MCGAEAAYNPSVLIIALLGLIGKVIREAFEYYPNQTFTLETGTEKARAVYAHYGYEVTLPIKVIGHVRC